MSGPFPEDSAARKTYPLYSGVLQYFPDALAAVAHHSYRGNEKHNPGQPLHWARDKSDDHLDAAARHLTEGDLVGLAWRALAALQLQQEAKKGCQAPRVVKGPRGENDRWILWNGNGICPFNPELEVHVRHLNGQESIGPAGLFFWGRGRMKGSDVVAYRVEGEGE